MGRKWVEHPSVIEENDGTLRLKVFKFMRTDLTLPKNLDGGMVVKNGRRMTIEEYNRGADGMSQSRNFENQPGKEGMWARIANWFKKRTKRLAPPITFGKAKVAIAKNTLVDGEVAARKMEDIIAKLLANGQVALAKRLANEKNGIANETVLVKNGMMHYLTEEDAINMLKTADFGIRIDFWNDYPELVPDEVLAAKRKADELKVFDNWCVMHYDPKGNALRQIVNEEWRRDPILFGMIVGSDRLYFVKDWKNQNDQLTIDKVCEMLHIKELRDATKYGANSEYGQVIASLRDELTTADEILPVNQ